MDRNEKRLAVEQLKENISNSAAVIVTHYAGLTVDEITGLRRKMREVGAEFKVTKNSLMKLALKDTEYESLVDLFSGPTAIGFSNDPVAAAKGIVEFSKENEKLVLLGGAMPENEMDVASVQALAKLPSLDELRGKLVALISTPATRIAGVVQAPGGQVARVINAYAQEG
ncbi:50S ribosomal protein L10 [Rickettsiales bacterium]|nr:50S ribosomal protein L10 [Rickettsiales bacterium]